MRIERIYIQNFGLIEEIDLSLSSGLNVVSGESGSGKSLFFKALRFVLGSPSSATYIRPGCDRSIIRIDFIKDSIDEESLSKISDFPSIPESFSIEKVIYENRSLWKIEGERVSQKTVKEFFKEFFYSFSQGDQFNLYSQSAQLGFTDRYGMQINSAYSDLLEDTKRSFIIYKKIEEELKRLKDESEVLFKEEDYNLYCLNEFIENNIPDSVDGITEIEKQHERISQRDEIIESVDSINSFVEMGKEVISSVERVCEYLDDSSFDSNAFKVSLKYLNSLSDKVISSIDESEESDVSKVMDKIHELMRKHRVNDFEGLVSVINDFTSKINDIEIIQEKIDKTEGELEDAYANYYNKANALSLFRNNAGNQLTEHLRSALLEMNFGYVDISFESEWNDDVASEKGSDSVQYLLSFNRGVEMAPLQNVVSGGEASRISLALLSIVESWGKIYLFDEIDSGLDPVSLASVSKRLRKISGEESFKNQILSISHNTEIKNIADSLIIISKSQDEDIAKSEVSEVIVKA